MLSINRLSGLLRVRMRKLLPDPLRIRTQAPSSFQVHTRAADALRIRTLKSSLFLAAISCLTLAPGPACKKHPGDPLSHLPPETSSGANTFGCLVNGTPFTPWGNGLTGPTLYATYASFPLDPLPDSPVGHPPMGAGLSITASDLHNSCNTRGIRIDFDSLMPEEGATYPLQTRRAGTAGATYSHLYCDAGNDAYYTSDLVTGQVHLSKLDFTHSIISGTFSFTAVSQAGDTVKVTDGRFDIPIR